ncbi:MAG: hypothetical protein P4L84_29190 [Isosphaeraceae bacterium]|nr:hypothetical protein [Isosphaeraceae bacterium]
MNSNGSRSDCNTSKARPLADSSKPPSNGPQRPRRLVPIVLAAGFVGSILSWTAGEGVVDQFKPRRAAEATNTMAVQFESAELDRTAVKNAALAYGIQGAALGLVLGIGGAASGGSIRSALFAGSAGLILGGATAAGAAFGAFTAYFQIVGGGQADLLPSILAHAGAWGPAGLVGGLALGLGLGKRDRLAKAVGGGILGAVAGAVLYDIVGSIAFPLNGTGEPLATAWPARLLAHGTVGLLAAIGAAVFAKTAGPP